MNDYFQVYTQLKARELSPEIYDVFHTEMRKAQGWIVPSPEAIEILQEHLPIVELGAGRGYWANLVTQKHKTDSYVCIDIDPPESRYFKVQYGDATSLLRFDNRFTLFICCPQYRSEMLLEALHVFPGKRLIYAGDHDFALQFGGEVQKELDENWERISIMDLPNWTKATNNKLSTWRRKIYANVERSSAPHRKSSEGRDDS